MKTIQTLFLALFFSIALTAQGYIDSIEWVKQFSDKGLTNLIIQTDPENNIYVAGSYTGCEDCFVIYDSDTLINKGNGSKDIFIAGIDSEGVLLQSYTIGGNDNELLSAFKLDSEGNILLYIHTPDTFYIDNVEVQPHYNLLKLDDNFNLLWAFNVKGSDHNRLDSKLGILREQLDVTSSNEIVIGGRVKPTINYDIIIDTILFETDTFFTYLSYYDSLYLNGNALNIDTTSIFVMQVDPAGNLQWIESFEHKSQFSGFQLTGIKVSANADVNVLGYFSTDDLIIGSDTLRADTSNGFSSRNIFLISLDNSGNINWANKYFSNQTPIDLSTDSEGNLVVAGYYYGKTFFEMDTLYSKGSSDFALFKLDKNGDFLWGQTVGDGTTNNHCVVMTDDEDRIYLSGNITSLVGEILNIYSPEGELVWKLNPHQSQNRSGQGLAFDQNGHLIHSAIYTGRFKVGDFTVEPISDELWWQNILVKYRKLNQTEQLTNLEDTHDENIYINIYPNPATDIVNVDYYLPNTGRFDLVLTNLQGQVIYSQSQTSGNRAATSFSVKDLDPGCYTVNIIGTNLITSTLLVVTR